MQSKSETIQILSQKADEANKKAHWWSSLSHVFLGTWVGGLALNLASQIFKKKAILKGFGGWNTPISPVEGTLLGGALVTFLGGAAKQERANSFHESIAEIQKMQPDSGNWQERVIASDVVSPTVKP